MKIVKWFALAGFLGALLVDSAGALEPGQSAPKRLYSHGDSITRGFNANFPLENLNLSWVNGYYGFWERLFGLPNVKSHNQRITANFGASDRRNWTAAQNGAELDDFLAQASGVAGKNVTYATVLLGANDICQISITNPPTDAEVEAEFRAGMDTLLNNLPSGATVQVVAVPDVTRLYDVGLDKTALGIVDCPLVWALTNPCQSVLSADVSDLERQFIRSRIIRYNEILDAVTAEKAVQHANKFISFTNVSFTFPFGASAVSDIDCFHPSWRGERVLSRETWNAGPFQAYQAGN
jgi:lysophospholipase L1-like esterase